MSKWIVAAFPFFLVSLLTVFALVLSGCDDDDDSSDDDHEDNNEDDDDDDNDDSFADDDDDDNDDNDSADDDNGDDDDDDNNDNDNDNDDIDYYAPPPSDEVGIFVAKNGNDANTGAMAEPKKTIAAALSAAASAGKVVFIAAGTYQEPLVAGRSLFGGYDSADWSRDPDANLTVILSGAPHSLTLNNALRQTLYLEGVTVEGFDQDYDGQVAGLAIQGGDTVVNACRVIGPNNHLTNGVAIEATGNIVIENSVIQGGNAPDQNVLMRATGIGVYSTGGSVVIRDNQIAAGAAEDYYMTDSPSQSVGLYIETAPEVETRAAGNTISGGFAYGDAAAFSDGVDVAAGRAIVVNNVIRAGTTDSGWLFITFATGVHTHFGNNSLLLVNNTIFSGLGAIGAAVQLESNATIVNNILFATGTALQSNPLFLLGDKLAIVISNNDFYCQSAATCSLVWVNQVAMNDLNQINACEWEPCLEASDNLAVLPGLVGMEDAHLRANSDLVDRGSPLLGYSFVPDLSTDIDGDTRPQGGGWDIGADEVVAAD